MHIYTIQINRHSQTFVVHRVPQQLLTNLACWSGARFGVGVHVYVTESHTSLKMPYIGIPDNATRYII